MPDPVFVVRRSCACFMRVVVKSGCVHVLWREKVRNGGKEGGRKGGKGSPRVVFVRVCARE